MDIEIIEVGKNHKKDRKRKEKIKENIAYYNELKQHSHCAICGEEHPACLDAYHLAKTRFSIPRAIRDMRISRARLDSELYHCVILCANCRKKYTRKQILKRFRNDEKRNGNGNGNITFNNNGKH